MVVFRFIVCCVLWSDVKRFVFVFAMARQRKRQAEEHHGKDADHNDNDDINEDNSNDDLLVKDNKTKKMVVVNDDDDNNINVVNDCVTTITTSTTTEHQPPITMDGQRPQKKFYRQRAHCNPLSHNDTFVYPFRPIDMNWISNEYYPMSMLNNKDVDQKKLIQPTILDIGCGFGGLTMSLAYLLPNEYILGMEIRAKVTEYVRLRIMNARKEYLDHNSNNSSTVGKIYTNSKPEHKYNNHHYNNCSVLRTNSMKFLIHYFNSHTISKIFICFPDPHFKRKNYQRRIINVKLLSIYAYILQKGIGQLCIITDVEELHKWHIAACNEHPLFQLVTMGSTSTISMSCNDDDNDDKTTLNDQQEQEQKLLINAMMNETEEGQKVTRNNGMKYYAIYRRIYDHEENDNVNNNEINSFNFFS